ncbi:MAG TPA: hypothetical protein VFU43_03535 [Streptosporangiaceae bacterium]|nr:hypothetical protein [Streptosporangiaceae bacterium]
MENPTNEWLISAAYGTDCRKRVSPELSAFYSSAVERLWFRLGESFAPSPMPQPVLEVVHSLVARPTVFRSDNSETLVYDQHLGQICNRLTRLALEDAPVQAVDQYVYRLFAQRSFVAGKFRSAALFGLLAKAQSADSWAPSLDSAALVGCSRLVAAQETFILGHELVHSHLSQNKGGPNERVSWYADLMSSVHKAPFHHADFPNVSDPDQIVSVFDQEYADSIRSALQRRGVSDMDIPSKVRKPGETASLLGTRERMAEILSSNSELLEECVCDAFAVIAGSKVLVRHGLNILDVASGAVLALHHLRLIQFLDRVASNRLGIDDIPSLFSLSDSFAQAVARVSMLRAFIVAILVMNKEAEVAQAVHRRLIDLNRIHATVIFDQVLHCMDFPATRSRLGEIPEVAESVEDLEADWKALKSLLGFV